MNHQRLETGEHRCLANTYVAPQLIDNHDLHSAAAVLLLNRVLITFFNTLLSD